MAKTFRVNQLVLSGTDAVNLFYPRSNPSGYSSSVSSTFSGLTNTGFFNQPPLQTGVDFSISSTPWLMTHNTEKANKDFLSFRAFLDRPAIVATAPWSKPIQYVIPSNATGVTSVGNTPLGFGTITTVADQIYGVATNFAIAANTGASGGINLALANLFIGNQSGYNGFFFTSRFVLPDTTGAYISGVSSGVNLFCGVTDQTFAATLSSNNPNNNRAGISFCRMTGTTGRNDATFQFTTKNTSSNTETLYPTTIPFNSGQYQAYIYAPTYPNTGSIYWALEDLYRGYSSTGLAFGANIPLANTALRGMLGMLSVSGTKNLRIQSLYIEV